MNVYAVIVAGGSGTRMGTDVAKQFLLLNNQPLLMHTLQTFAQITFKKIILVLPASSMDYWKQLVQKYNCTIPHEVVAGGTTRFHSVQHGLDAIADEQAIVAVHDGVRALVTVDCIQRVVSAAIEKGNAIPVVPVVDSLRLLAGDTNTSFERKNVVAVQTPQCFHVKQLKEAFHQPWQEHFTDEATVLQSIGVAIHLVEGEAENIKITRPVDLAIVEHVLKQRKQT